MNSIELQITVSDSTQSEILLAELSDWPFDSFSEETGVLNAYATVEHYESCRTEVENYLNEKGLVWEIRIIGDTNWNAVWESNFEPIDLEGRCRIRAPFHEAPPAGEIDLVIMPKMSFGTGHHATTRLMVEEILDMQLDGLTGLDMGSGTGVLAILCVKHGAQHMDAIDIDEWAFTNSTENITTNHLIGKINPEQGDASLLQGRHYDFVIANINRNILLHDMQAYIQTLSQGGKLVMSGILTGDIPVIVSHAESLGMHFEGERQCDGWAAARFSKQ